jgi:hypothetical protein
MKNLILVWTLFIAILTAAMANLQLSFAQEQIENNDDSNNNTKITKTSTNSYIIVDDGPELVGAFDTIYTISGSSESLNKSKESILSIIQDDLDNSPTIGYIRAEASNQTQTEGVGLPNPFVDLRTINSTVTQQLSDSINSASALNSTIVEIKCDFGMNIMDWKCEDHGIF